MRLLFVSLSLPFPPKFGQRLRNWTLLKALNAEGHKVTVVTFATPGETAEGLTGVSDSVRMLPLPCSTTSHWTNWFQRLRALVLRQPYGLLRHTSANMKAAVMELTSRNHYDAVLCDDVYQLQNTTDCRSPVILNKHDFVFEIMGRFIERQKNPAVIAYARMEQALLSKWEAMACSMVRANLVCSERDRQVLKRIAPNAHAAVVSNGIDTASYQVSPEDDGLTVVYLGAMEWLPNQDAVRYFAGEIFPTIRDLVPGVRFLVVGRNPPARLVSECQRAGNVSFTGEVSDVRPFLAQCAVTVVPLRIGSGTRLKILEASAMGKPTVATTIGAEGLSLVDGDEIIRADESLKFAQAVAELLASPTLRKAIGRAARRRVENEYGLAAVRRELGAAFLEFGFT